MPLIDYSVRTRHTGCCGCSSLSVKPHFILSVRVSNCLPLQGGPTGQEKARVHDVAERFGQLVRERRVLVEPSQAPGPGGGSGGVRRRVAYATRRLTTPVIVLITPVITPMRATGSGPGCWGGVGVGSPVGPGCWVSPAAVDVAGTAGLVGTADDDVGGLAVAAGIPLLVGVPGAAGAEGDGLGRLSTSSATPARNRTAPRTARCCARLRLDVAGGGVPMSSPGGGMVSGNPRGRARSMRGFMRGD
jgi:hypothetical protein